MFNKPISQLPLWLGLLMSFSACSVGQNDHAMSFLNRTGKLAGTWELIELERESSNRWDANSDTYRYSYHFEDGEMTFRSDGTSETYDFDYEITFSKEGGYTLELEEDGDDYAEEGAWSWAHANGTLELNNKEALFLTGLVYEYSGYEDRYEGQGVPPDATWVLRRLTKDQMVVHSHWENTDDDGYRYEVESTMVFSKN